MKRNEKKWLLCNEVNKEKINSEWMDKMKKADKSGILSYRNAVTKSYKYIGPISEDSTDLITFNADAWKQVAQNQISLF